MEFLNKLDLKPGNIFKFLGLTLVGIIILAFVFQIINSVFLGMDRDVSYQKSISNSSYAPTYDYAMEESAGLSLRNVANSMDYDDGSAMGGDAEDFEITEYNGTIETRNKEEVCGRIAGLKSLEYVIFENANDYDKGCNYSFKVETDRTEEVLNLIEDLDPKNLTENTRTIKKLLDDYTSELDILNKKKETIENTLDDAIKSYDEISKVATQARDAESLAKIIDSKIKIIERLSQERIDINEQIDRMNRSKAEQMDKLAYTYFYLNVYENKFVDSEELKDSWKSAVKTFVRDVNEISQNVSIRLVTVVLKILEFLLYLVLVLIAGKYFWKMAKYIWRK